MNESQLIERANRAQAVLDNPLYDDAYNLVRLAIIDQIEKLPLADVSKAEDLRKCLKLLRDVRANLTEVLNSGKIVSFKISEAEKAKKNAFRNYFR